jgi:hypothetical protein
MLATSFEPENIFINICNFGNLIVLANAIFFEIFNINYVSLIHQNFFQAPSKQDWFRFSVSRTEQRG